MEFEMCMLNRWQVKLKKREREREREREKRTREGREREREENERGKSGVFMPVFAPASQRNRKGN
jgi:hypothetical protein